MGRECKEIPPEKRGSSQLGPAAVCKIWGTDRKEASFWERGYYHGKFADLQYVRPDMEKVFARVSGDIAALKEAKEL